MSTEDKELRAAAFTVHATRGIIRDRKARRNVMFVVLLIALFMMVGGSTFLTSALDPREHPTRFILFWLACAWVTVAALLLALFDLLMVRRDARALRENLLREAAAAGTISSPNSRDGE